MTGQLSGIGVELSRALVQVETGSRRCGEGSGPVCDSFGRRGPALCGIGLVVTVDIQCGLMVRDVEDMNEPGAAGAPPRPTGNIKLNKPIVGMASNPDRTRLLARRLRDVHLRLR